MLSILRADGLNISLPKDRKRETLSRKFLSNFIFISLYFNVSFPLFL